MTQTEARDTTTPGGATSDLASASARSKAVRLRRRRRTQVVWAARLAIFAVFLGVWQYKGSSSDYDALVFSTPRAVLSQIWEWLFDPLWREDLGTTLSEAGAGYLLGVAGALALVAITAPSATVMRFLSPFIAAMNALPKIALAPVFILWFGTAYTSKVLFVASLIGFMIFYGVLAALRTIDQTLLANMRVLGASKAELLWHVYVPATFNQVVSSLRLSSAWALLAAVVAEYLAANKGLGFLIAEGQQTFQTDNVIAGIVVVAVIAVALDRGLVWIERRFSQWRPVGPSGSSF